MHSLDAIRFREATEHDVEGLVAIVADMDGAMLFGPIERGSRSVEAIFREQFRVPYGSGGYRYTTVLELNGVIRAFLIAMPLTDVGEFFGDVLPLSVLNRRYGQDLSRVLHISLIGVTSTLQGQGFATQICNYTYKEAQAQHYDFIMGQAWIDNKASADGLMKKYGGDVFHETEFKMKDGDSRRAVFFNVDCRGPLES